MAEEADPREVSIQVSQEGHGRRRSNHSKVSWDEAKIQEHDKLRGTRQKIDEPKTPYNKASLSDASEGEDEEEEDGLSRAGCRDKEQRACDSTAVKGGIVVKSAPLDGAALSARLDGCVSENSAPSAAEHSKKEDFKAARKAHYNEFEMLKRWREQHVDEDDDADDEEDAAD